MKAKEAIERYGSLEGLKKTVSDIAGKYKIAITVNEDDDSMRIVFEVSDEDWEFTFPTAREKLNLDFMEHNLQLLFERCADKDNTPIMSYVLDGFSIT